MQHRKLNVHEYCGMELLAKHGVPVPENTLCKTPQETKVAFEAYTQAHGKRDMVIKAQVLAGGRGKGKFSNGFKGGVHVVCNAAEAADFASKMLGQRLITKQTSAQGQICDKVLLTERLYLRRETYFSILMDRSHSGPTLVASSRGGTSIEDVAHETPELIHTEKVDIMTGVQPEQLERLAGKMGFEGKSATQAVDIMSKLYNLFIQTDATLVEINPLAETPDGDVFACDSKLNFDDNAEFRQSGVFAYRDRAQEDPKEVEASQYGLNYISLDGTIGCLVNGAGLAMATMDIIKLNGGSPSNFLDVGGGATKQQIEKAFNILNDDKSVKAILVNIFGGILRCDVLAKGIVSAAQKVGLAKPLVIRMQGTNVGEAKKLIEGSGYRMLMCDDLEEAAAKVVRIADIVKQAEQIQVGVSFEIPVM
jgi:succinyl-CoA synthetase beta subunit